MSPQSVKISVNLFKIRCHAFELQRTLHIKQLRNETVVIFVLRTKKVYQIWCYKCIVNIQGWSKRKIKIKRDAVVSKQHWTLRWCLFWNYARYWFSVKPVSYPLPQSMFTVEATKWMSWNERGHCNVSCPRRKSRS